MLFNDASFFTYESSRLPSMCPIMSYKRWEGSYEKKQNTTVNLDLKCSIYTHDMFPYVLPPFLKNLLIPGCGDLY
jgi:hypothetical protein